MYICQMNMKDQLRYYKLIKEKLLELGIFSYEALRNAMNSKVTDLEYLI